MDNVNECSICLENIDQTNYTLTSCGHCFHTNCLITNVQHNGTGCPYCRNKLAEEIQEEEEEEEEEDNAWQSWANRELYGDRELAGFRMFHQRISGEEVEEEEEEEEDAEDEEEEEEEEEPIRPSPAFIARKLTDQGVTMEDLVKILLERDHEEYADYEDRADIQVAEGEVFGKFRIIISNFKEGDEPPIQIREQPVRQEQPQVQEPVRQEEPSPLVHIVDNETHTTYIGYTQNIRRRAMRWFIE
jgi:hypothetical protein